jgi:hypothetical protein
MAQPIFPAMQKLWGDIRSSECTGGSNDNAADQATNYMKVWDSPGDGPPSDFRLIVPQAIPENGGRRGKARTR